MKRSEKSETNSKPTSESKSTVGDAEENRLIDDQTQQNQTTTASFPESISRFSNGRISMLNQTNQTNMLHSSSEGAHNYASPRHSSGETRTGRLKRPRDGEGSDSDSDSQGHNRSTQERNVSQRVEHSSHPTAAMQPPPADPPAQLVHQAQAPNVQAQPQNPMVMLPNPALLIGYDSAGNPIHVPTSPLLYLIHFFASLMGVAANAYQADPNTLLAPPPPAAEQPQQVPSMSPTDSVLMPPPPPVQPRISQTPPPQQEQYSQQGEQQQHRARVGNNLQHQPSVQQTPPPLLPAGSPAVTPNVAPMDAASRAFVEQALTSAAARNGTILAVPPATIPPTAAALPPEAASLLSSILPAAMRTTLEQHQTPPVPPTLGGLGRGAERGHQQLPSASLIPTPPTPAQPSAAGQNMNMQQWSFVPTAGVASAGPFGGILTSSAGRMRVQPPVSLYMDCDDDHLSEYQILVRKQLELFEAQPEDVQISTRGRKKQLVLGQVGIRCRHCSTLPYHQRGKGAVYYPAKMDGLYQAAQNMAKSHLSEACNTIDVSLKEQLVRLRESKTVGATRSGGKQYWADGAKALGVYEGGDCLRFAKSSSL